MFNLPFLVPIWQKIFSHDTAGGLFANHDEAKQKNINDESADLFSILYDLESMRNDDGMFHFKLCYPEQSGCNEWIQSSNPLLESTVTGYADVNLTWTKSGLNGPFQGLGLSPPSASKNLIDDLPNHANNYMSIGTMTYWGDTNTIPGPKEVGKVKKVEWYVFYTPSKSIEIIMFCKEVLLFSPNLNNLKRILQL